MPNQRQRRERREAAREVDSAQGWAQQMASGNYLDLPSGLPIFNQKKEDVYRLEFIPYEVGKGNPNKPEGAYWHERTYWIHQLGFGQDAEKACCLRTFGKQCPICEESRAMMQDPKTKDMGFNLKRKERQLFLVYCHNEPDKGVQLWDISRHLFGRYLAEKIRKADPADREAYGRFASPTKGMTLRCSPAEDSAGGGKFLRWSDIEFKRREKPLDPKLFDHGICLDDLPRETPYGELRRIFLGVDPDEGGDGDDRPSANPSRNGAAARGRDAEPDDDGDSGDGDGPGDDDFEVGDEVVFEYKGKERTGRIKKINAAKGLALVDCGGDYTASVELADLVLAEDDDFGDEEVEPEDEDSKPRRGGQAPSKPSGKKPPRSSADDENEDDDLDDLDSDLDDEDADDSDSDLDDEDEGEEAIDEDDLDDLDDEPEGGPPARRGGGKKPSGGGNKPTPRGGRRK